MRKRREKIDTGMLWYTENGSGLLLWLGGEQGELGLIKALKELTRNTLPSARWDAVVDRDQWGRSPVPPLHKVLPLEAVELLPFTKEERETLFQGWSEDLKEGRRPFLMNPTTSLGQSAQERSYIPRPDDEKALTGFFEQREVALLVAPRRTGKTSLMKHLNKQRPIDTMYLNLEKFEEDPRKHFSAELRKNLDNISFIDALESPESSLEDLFQRIVEKGFCALMLDEIVAFLSSLEKKESKEAVVRWLDELLKARKNHSLSLVLSGSFALDHYLDEITSRNLVSEYDIQRRVLAPLQGTAFDWRQHFMGAGYLLTQKEMDWLTENLDFVMPYQAKSWLASLSGEQITIAELQESLEVFYRDTSSFRDLELQIENLYARFASQAKQIQGIIRRVVESAEGLLWEDLHPRLTSDDNKPKIRQRLLDILPFREEKKTKKIRCTSKLFRGWWLSQQAR